MNEINQLLSVCQVHLVQVEVWLGQGEYGKAEFRARELSENAKLLSNALFREQRNSGEVKA
jgi:hypothetical protein